MNPGEHYQRLQEQQAAHQAMQQIQATLGGLGSSLLGGVQQPMRPPTRWIRYSNA